MFKNRHRSSHSAVIGLVCGLGGRRRGPGGPFLGQLPLGADDAVFNLTVVDSTTDNWSPYVARASVTGRSPTSSTWFARTAPRPTGTGAVPRARGAVRICNQTYGNTGWLGIAGISIDGTGHIVAGYTKLNDSVLQPGLLRHASLEAERHLPGARAHVGLDHQDEDFNNASLYTCMDYQVPPFRVPNDHDYAELETIYAHLTPTTRTREAGAAVATGGSCNAPPGKGCNKADAGQGHSRADWGISLGRKGAKEKFLRIEPDGTRHLTFVTWAEGY